MPVPSPQEINFQFAAGECVSRSFPQKSLRPPIAPMSLTMADFTDITYSPSDGVRNRWTPDNSTRKLDQTAFTALESETPRAVSSLFATDREVSQVLERIKRRMHPRTGRLDFKGHCA